MERKHQSCRGNEHRSNLEVAAVGGVQEEERQTPPVMD